MKTTELFPLKVYPFLFNYITVELQHLWNYENMFETGAVLANECLS